MDLNSFIHEAVFEEKDKYTRLYELIWSEFEQDGFVITDEPGHEIDALFKATAIQNLIGEFEYRLYDEVNETGYEDVVDYLAQIGVSQDDIVAYCEQNENIDTFDDDEDLKIKNGFDEYKEEYPSVMSWMESGMIV